MNTELSRRSLIASGVAAGALGGCKPGSGVTELVVWQTETDPNAVNVLKSVKKQFEADHKGVTVTIESVPWGTLATKLNAAVSSQTLPDISHLEPFMTYSFVHKGLLEPITDLINDLEKKNGPIFEAVKNLQSFDNEYYGLAYAVGVTGWTYDTRKSANLPLPYPADTAATISTDQFLAYLKAVKARGGKATVLLPGGSPFFIDQLVGELVGNAGGTLFDSAAKAWLFESEPVKRAMGFLLELKKQGVLDPDWASQQYQDQFSRLAKMDSTDNVFVTPVTYARAAVAIRKQLEGEGKAVDANDSVFRFMSQPTFPGAGVDGPIGTIDCEPYVLFAEPARRDFNGRKRRELSIDFLKRFYDRKNYLEFTKQVPIHLTPVFKNLATDPDYLSTIGKWQAWHDHTMRFLLDANRTRPILVPGHDPAKREMEMKNPYLLDLQAQHIISDGVAKMLTATEAVDIGKVLKEMQDRATRLITP